MPVWAEACRESVAVIAKRDRHVRCLNSKKTQRALLLFVCDLDGRGTAGGPSSRVIPHTSHVKRPFLL